MYEQIHTSGFFLLYMKKNYENASKRKKTKKSFLLFTIMKIDDIIVSSFKKSIVVVVVDVKLWIENKDMSWKPDDLSLHELMNVEVMRIVIKFDCNMKVRFGIGEIVEEVALKNSDPLVVWQPNELIYIFEGVESCN